MYNSISIPDDSSPTADAESQSEGRMDRLRYRTAHPGRIRKCTQRFTDFQKNSRGKTLKHLYLNINIMIYNNV